jgi:hypothetical protein
VSTCWNADTQTCQPYDVFGGFSCNSQVAAPSKPSTVFALVATRDYFPISASNGSLSWRVDTLVPPVVAVCPLPAICNPAGDYYFRCAAGYDPASLLCSRCLEGYYQDTDNSCVPCASFFAYLIPILDILIFVWLVVYLWRTPYKSSTSAMLSISLFYLQLTSILDSNLSNKNASAGGTGDDAGQDGVDSLLGLSFIRSLASFRPYAFECVNHRIDYVVYFWIMAAATFLLTSAFVTVRACCLTDRSPSSVLSHQRSDGHLASLNSVGDSFVDRPQPYSPLIGHPSSTTSASSSSSTRISAVFVEPLVSRHHDPSSLLSSSEPGTDRSTAHKFLFLTCFLLNLLYFPMVTKLFEVLHCSTLFVSSEFGSLHFMSSQPYIACFEGPHTAMFVGSVLLLILLIILPVSALVYIARRRKTLDKDPARYYIGFLWATTKESAFFWDSAVVLIRKLAIAIALTLFPRLSIFIPMLVFVILLVSILVLVLVQPYRSAFDNRLELGLMTVALFSYLGGVLITVSFGSSANGSENNPSSARAAFVRNVTSLGPVLHGVDIAVRLFLLLLLVYNQIMGSALREKLGQFGNWISDRCCCQCCLSTHKVTLDIDDPTSMEEPSS